MSIFDRYSTRNAANQAPTVPGTEAKYEPGAYYDPNTLTIGTSDPSKIMDPHLRQAYQQAQHQAKHQANQQAYQQGLRNILTSGLHTPMQMEKQSKQQTRAAIPRLSLDDVVSLLCIAGAEQAFVLRSEPGVGKSSTLRMKAERNGDKWRKPGDYYPTDKYVYVYFDCPFRDVPDVVSGIPVMETKRIEQFIAAALCMDDPRPKVIMLDEILKSAKLLQLIFMRLLLEHFIGDSPLPEGSIVYGTSNNGADGVGDTVMSHGANRVTFVEVQKPDVTSLCAYMERTKVSGITRAWVTMNPRVLASYRDEGFDDSNPYVFNPRKPNQESYASPRSIVRNDVYVRNHDKMSDDMLFASMAGTVGASAAADLLVFIRMQASLTPPAKVIKDPLGTPLPTSPAATCLLVQNLCDYVKTQDDLSAACTYINRLEHEELQSMFYHHVTSGSPRIAALAALNPVVTEWIRTHDYELVTA